MKSFGQSTEYVHLRDQCWIRMRWAIGYR